MIHRYTGSPHSQGCTDESMSEDQKQVEIDRLRGALEFYANEDTHRARMEDDTAIWPILLDKGRRARAALGKPEPPTFAQRLESIVGKV